MATRRAARNSAVRAGASSRRAGRIERTYAETRMRSLRAAARARLGPAAFIDRSSIDQPAEVAGAVAARRVVRRREIIARAHFHQPRRRALVLERLSAGQRGAERVRLGLGREQQLRA